MYWQATKIHGLYRSILNKIPASNDVRKVIAEHAKSENIGNFGRFVSTQEYEELDIFAEQLLEEQRLRKEMAWNTHTKQSTTPYPVLQTLCDDAFSTAVVIRVFTQDDNFSHKWSYQMSVTYNSGNREHIRTNFLKMVENRLAEARKNPDQFFCVLNV